MFENGEHIGKYANTDSVLWMPRLYTIRFDQNYICQFCPMVETDFINQVFELMRNREPKPVYGKLGYSIIKTKQSVRKHFERISDWEFYYDDGSLARKTAILNDIYSINSYLLEDLFSSEFESNWPTTLSTFLGYFTNQLNETHLSEQVTIPVETAHSIFSFFFMMLCRNPSFDGLGFFPWIQDTLLSAFGEESQAEVEDYKRSLWLTELYKMLYNKKRGYFHTFMEFAKDHNQFLLFETSKTSEPFLTSDTPAFMNRSNYAEASNKTGYVFPLTPDKLLFIGKGQGKANIVERRFATRDTVREWNQIIRRNSSHCVISSKEII